MRPAAALIGLLLLAACGETPPRPDGDPTGAHWEALPNDDAVHFRLWRAPDAMAALVLGTPGDTLARLVLADAVTAPAGPFPGPWTAVRPNDLGLVLLSTTHAAYIAALGAVPKVTALAWPGLQRDSTVEAALAAGRIAGLADGAEARLEQLTALSPALVLDPPFGGGAGRLPKGHVPVPVCEYMEPHPLGRAEWLRFFGAVTGRMHAADSLYAAIAARYRALAHPPGEGAPLVFIGSAWRGTWSVPAGNSLTARLVADAGGRYRYAHREAPGNIDLPLEAVMADAHACTHWGVLLDVPGLRRADQVPGVDGRMLNTPVFRTGTVFAANAAASDLFGRAMVEPDVMLADLRAVLHPQELPQHRPVYFRRLPQ